MSIPTLIAVVGILGLLQIAKGGKTRISFQTNIQQQAYRMLSKGREAQVELQKKAKPKRHYRAELRIGIALA